MQGAQEVGKSATIDNGLGMHTMSDSTQRKGIAAVQGSQTKVPTFRTSFFLFNSWYLKKKKNRGCLYV